ncbi:pantoate--beta-alanine ligase [Microscilla marina]|uniref:Pantothenate synthetase n=1 Tax=Microscilla marina ATCC 23134 TaxID=313606 RepID=A1ZXU0_MICM2|nr:pantoate--beta-alanine ligase [Microscilla marina]EAY24769.1 pantoate--beta-alanine ligase [Microscilla marina ATCC 23134]
MFIFEDIIDLKNHLKVEKQQYSIGFVPTMGALHQGHLSLIDRAKADNDVVVCSIFVNPTQFNNVEDLKNYPKTIKEDKKLLEAHHCDVLFLPDAHTMYPVPAKTSFSFGHLEQTMEGEHRAGHFNGVALVVSKLFHLIKPHRAYFGQKDLQQFIIIHQLVQDLLFDLEVVCCPIVREDDGLAMSSRNLRLTASQRPIASKLYEALMLARHSLLEGYGVSKTKQTIQNFFNDLSDLQLEYFEVVKSATLETVDSVSDTFQVSLCIAAFLGDVRLIDNVFLFDKKGIF